MIPEEILKKVRWIDIRTNHMVNDVLAGQYKSVFKGQGMEFEEVREYQPGDEVRSIDWNVTARMGRPFLKKFVEERELTVMLVLDVSSSSQFGSIKQLKGELATELCAVLASSAIKIPQSNLTASTAEDATLSLPFSKSKSLLNFTIPRLES